MMKTGENEGDAVTLYLMNAMSLGIKPVRHHLWINEAVKSGDINPVH